MSTYYNENDPKAAAWLRELIKAGLIAPGDVDKRSISDVKAVDLIGYTQCHFFAGIGGWSYALRLAGWPDNRPVWTGSCPCQPFSAAGKGEGAADARHLWPEWFRLIREHRPVAIFGEQVSAAIRHGWLDLVSADLEGLGYAVGAAVMGAHSVGAPHIRQRLYFVADAQHPERRPQHGPIENERDGDDAGRSQAHGVAGTRSAVCELADADLGAGGQGRALGARRDHRGDAIKGAGPFRRGWAGDMGDTEQPGLQEQRGQRGVPCGQGGAEPRQATIGASASVESVGNTQCAASARQRQHGGKVLSEQEAERLGRAGPTNGFWRNAYWLHCIDGKARPVEPGSFPLAHGIPARMGRLRGYGNAIVPQVAAEFIRAYAG